MEAGNKREPADKIFLDFQECLNRSCAGKETVLHQIMTKWRANVVDQDCCGDRKQRGGLHDQDSLCNSFCGWSSQWPAASCAV